MHILLVSQCEKKAILRTAKVLDAYAVRHGDRTWVTPITRNGLDALYRELRSRGTRQTASLATSMTGRDGSSSSGWLGAKEPSARLVRSPWQRRRGQ